MNRPKLQELEREAVRTRRKLNKVTDRQEEERVLKAYAKLLREIIDRQEI